MRALLRTDRSKRGQSTSGMSIGCPYAVASREKNLSGRKALTYTNHLYQLREFAVHSSDKQCRLMKVIPAFAGMTSAFAQRFFVNGMSGAYTQLTGPLKERRLCT